MITKYQSKEEKRNRKKWPRSISVKLRVKGNNRI